MPRLDALLSGFVAATCLACSNPSPGGPGGASAAESSPAPPPAGPSEGAEPAPTARPAPSVEDLIEASIEAAGGREAIAAIETLYIESKIESGAQNIEARSRLWWKQGRFYVEQEIPGFGRATSGYDGQVAWIDEPISGYREPEGLEREQLIRGGAVFELADWRRWYVGASVLGARALGDRTLWDVELTTVGGDTVTISFDDDSKLVTQVAFVQRSPLGDMAVKLSLSDHRPVAGYRFPHRQEASVGLLTITEIHERIEPGAAVDERKFSPLGRELAVEPGRPRD